MKAEKNNNKSKLAFRGGSYSIAITAVVLAIFVAVNIFADTLPSHLTQLDISSSKLYSITSNTKAVVNALEEDVTVYWVVQADKEDEIIENLLAKYEAQSEHIKVVKKNPDVYPTFTQQYTSEEVPNNSLIVECGERYRYVPYNDIFLVETDIFSYNYSTEFDGEGALTSAIDYVVTEELPRMYLLEGHGEAALPSGFADSVEKENIETAKLSLLTVDAVPEDADCIMIYAPQSDISEAEKDMLSDYAENGGKLLIISGPLEDAELTNLNSLLLDYGVEVVDGIVLEGSRENYALGYPYILMPDLGSTEITDPLIAENYFPLMPVTQGLKIENPEDPMVKELMRSSPYSYSKIAGYEFETYEKEEGDIDGPFSLGVSIDTDAGGNIIFFSSFAILDDMYNAYSSGANADLVMNAVSSLIGEREAIAIRSKSLNYNYLTINDSNAAFLKTMMIGVFPLAYLGVGIVNLVRKRGKQYEAV